MKTEGQVRIPSGCAIAAMISRDGNKMSGETITNAMKPMHDRSNGLGGGFAGYGIYPEYKDSSVADVVAEAMKEWAVSKGATHYTHWFQPLTGITAKIFGNIFLLHNETPFARKKTRMPFLLST